MKDQNQWSKKRRKKIVCAKLEDKFGIKYDITPFWGKRLHNSNSVLKNIIKLEKLKEY